MVIPEVDGRLEADRRTPTLGVRTLIRGGFVLDGAHRNPGYTILRAHRIDEFGAEHRYAFAVADDGLNKAQVAAAQIDADHHRSQLVIIGRSNDEVPSLEWGRFVNLFGGPVYSTMPLDPAFADQLRCLGRNELPDGMTGRADDLFEEYVRVALEFLLGTRVIRYGQERRFERRPDGLVLPLQGFSALYDAKAYADGYPVTVDTLRQFKDYVEDFQRRYNAYLPRLNSFIVVSGEFTQGEDALVERSREFVADRGVPLSFLTVDAFVEVITLVAQHPAARRSVNWAHVFSDPVVAPDRVRRELEAIRKDGIIPGA